jgi:hypothetical protein
MARWRIGMPDAICFSTELMSEAGIRFTCFTVPVNDVHISTDESPASDRCCGAGRIAIPREAQIIFWAIFYAWHRRMSRGIVQIWLDIITFV